MSNALWLRFSLPLAGILVLAGLLLWKQPESSSSGKIQVTASFYPLAFFAQRIGGDNAEVKNLTPAGAEPHDYELTAKDLAAIEHSNLLILNGGGLESWGQDIVKNLEPDSTLIITAGEGLTSQTFVDDEADAEITDPHVWLSPALAIQMVEKIEQGFLQIDPLNASAIRANTQTLETKLSELDEEFRQSLLTCATRDFITAHAAFGYLALSYQLNQVPISDLSADTEPSAQKLAEIASFAKEKNIKVIFVEQLLSPKLSQTIANEIGAQTLVLNPLEGLTPEEITADKDYFTEMRQNLSHLTIALQCTT